MYNARIIQFENHQSAFEEMCKIDVDARAAAGLILKAQHVAMKLENVSSFDAIIIKQEMLSKGGETAVNRKVTNNSIDRSDILIMGTPAQYSKLVNKLKIYSESLKEIAAEIERLLNIFWNGDERIFKCRGFSLHMGEKTYVMGILNITPDSFSDGGKYDSTESAVRRAKEMVEQGADIIDVGGESTRPGHVPVEPEEEIKRVVPVIERLCAELDVPVSIDTSKAVVARAALEAGAHMVNDVWGLQRDAGMAETISGYNAGVIMMHNKDDKSYSDLMGEIIGYLNESVSIAEKSGISRSSMAIDPGIGFGKTIAHNIEVIRRLKELKTLDMPILLGTSRKSFIGNILNLPVDERVEGTAATVAIGIANGADIVRVHDVKEIVRLVKMTDAITRADIGDINTEGL
jgi:dihydropteroate synthase